MAPSSVHFWPHLPSADVASTRIRCLQVMAALQARGWSAQLYTPGAARPQTLVLGKRYDAVSLQHAQDMRQQHGTRIVLDLCDNHFYAAQDDDSLRRRAEALRSAVLAADLVVASSNALAAVLREQAPGLRQLRVIDDALDPMALPAADTSLGGRFQRLRLAAFFALHRAAPGRRLVWFGQHGSGFADAGMSDIDRIADALAAHHAQQPLSLTVVSNRWRRYRTLAPRWRFPSLYLPWTAASFGTVLQRHDVAVIPVTPNPFTLCKTSNRAVTAFAAGLVVASDPMPAYDEMGEAIVVGDWQAGLAALMASSAERTRRQAAAQAIIARRHGAAAIAEQWEHALRTTTLETAPA